MTMLRIWEGDNMKFIELKEEEFTTFSLQSPHKTFLQTAEIAKIRSTDHWGVHYVGVQDDTCLVCATMLLSKKKFMNKREFYSPRGYLIDFNNDQLLAFFTSELKKFIKKKNGYVLRIDPYVLNKERDEYGDIVENGIDNTRVVNHLEKLKYQKVAVPEQVKWMFVMDVENMTEVKLLKSFKPTTRNIIKKTIKNGVRIRELGYDELDEFEEIMRSTSIRKNFDTRSLAYYQTMYNLFSKRNEIKYLVAELNLLEYLSILEKGLEQIIAQPDKNENEQAIAVAGFEKRIKNAKELISKHDEKIVLSASMFILYGDEVVYLFGGNYGEFMEFNGQYALQWEMMKHAVNNQFKTYNFYGISGNFDKNDPDYGIYEFKRKFQGYVIELIGEFALPISSYYNVFNFFGKIKSKLKKVRG